MTPDTLYIQPVMPQTAETPTISLSATEQTSRNGVERRGMGRHAADAPKLPHATYDYRGHWPLSKPSHDPRACWQITLVWRKAWGGGPARKRVRRSLGFSGLADAKVVAKGVVDRFLLGALAPQAPVVQTCRLVDIIGPIAGWPDALGVVPALPITANLTTRRSYVWSLRWVVRLALALDDAAIEGLRSEALNKDFARKFFAEVMRRANLIASQGERATWLNTATTFYNNARCLFAPAPLDALRETHKLVIPASIEDFRKGQKLFLAEKLSDASDFERPPDAVVLATWREWLRLGVTPGYAVPGAHKSTPRGQVGHTMALAPLSELDRRNAFIVVGLALSCALRIDEIERVKWDWFRIENGHPLLCEYAVNVKNRSGGLRVKPLDPFWRTLNRIVDRNGWRPPAAASGATGGAGAYCLAERPQSQAGMIVRGGKCDRTEWPKTHVARWLRWLGWTTQKSNHALRDLSCSWVTMKFGLDRACIHARHKHSSTTAKHYNRFVDADVMDDFKRLAWLSWAK